MKAISAMLLGALCMHLVEVGIRWCSTPVLVVVTEAPACSAPNTKQYVGNITLLGDTACCLLAPHSSHSLLVAFHSTPRFLHCSTWHSAGPLSRMRRSHPVLDHVFHVAAVLGAGVLSEAVTLEAVQQGALVHLLPALRCHLCTLGLPDVREPVTRENGTSTSGTGSWG
jgi:hypothetical protein